MTEKIDEDDLWCEYSDMPSPLAYIKNKDHGGVKSHGKLSKKEQDEKNDSKDCVMDITQVPKEKTKINLGFIKLI